MQLNYWQLRYLEDIVYGFMISCVLLVIGNAFLTPKITVEMLPQYFAAMMFAFVFVTIIDFQYDFAQCRNEMFDRYSYERFSDCAQKKYFDKTYITYRRIICIFGYDIVMEEKKVPVPLDRIEYSDVYEIIQAWGR